MIQATDIVKFKSGGQRMYVVHVFHDQAVVWMLKGTVPTKEKVPIDSLELCAKVEGYAVSHEGKMLEGGELRDEMPGELLSYLNHKMGCEVPGQPGDHEVVVLNYTRRDLREALFFFRSGIRRCGSDDCIRAVIESILGKPSA